MLRLFSLLLLCCFASPAPAMVGNAPPADPSIARHLVLIVSSRGSSCTGVVVARDLILTAGHCASPDAQYKFVTFDSAGNAKLNDIASAQRHPQFDLNAFNNHRATADVALMKTALPLPANFAPARIGAPQKLAVGQQFLVAGYGLAVPGDGRSGGKARQTRLTVTGQPGSLQIRLVDPATSNAAPGLGGCTGDSGAPAFDTASGAPVVIGLVSWTTAARNDAGCGGLTGVTPLTRYRAWIVETAAKLGSAAP
jgi:secreted trypsin-like serine protease